MRTVLEPKVVVSSAVEPEERDELERLARDGDRTLSQEIRRALRRYMESERDDEQGGEP
jgi:hypothetical protein